MDKLNEAYSASSDEQRSFEDIYGDKLFEDTDDLIDPRFKKLFESVYEGGKFHPQRLREATTKDGKDTDPGKKKAKAKAAEDPDNGNQGGGDDDWKTPNPKHTKDAKRDEKLFESIIAPDDGINDGAHNRPGLENPDPEVAQTEPGQNCNCPIFNKRDQQLFESIIGGKKPLREMMARCDNCGASFDSHEGGTITDEGITLCEDCIEEGREAGEEQMYRDAIGDL